MDTYFDVQDHVIVTNPTDEQFIWTVGGEREYAVDPGQVKRLHGSAAGLYVKKMTDLLIIQSNQVQQLHDVALRKEMADKLIVRIVKDNEDVEVPEKDLEELAKKNDSAPVEKLVEFPDINKQPFHGKDLSTEVHETEKPVEKAKEDVRPTAKSSTKSE